MRLRCRLLFLAVLLALGGLPARSQSGDGIHKIRHIVIIMQENRSFDTYFGTFPGADGIPMTNGVPSACVPNPRGGSCVRPFYDTSDVDRGGPHNAKSAVGDVDGGRMDGFLEQMRRGRKGCADPNAPNCAGAADVMGYHDGRQLVNYWRYARDFVLQDKLFEPNASWSLPQHLFMVSEWSAACSRIGDPMSCVNELQRPDEPPDYDKRNRQVHEPGHPDYAWTDLTYLLHGRHVSWAYYIMSGTAPDCANNEEDCAPMDQRYHTPGIWNVLPYFDTVKKDGELGNIRDLRDFYTAAQNGTLPSVVWICPAGPYSEHPPALIQPRSVLRNRPHQCGHAKPRLEEYGDLLDVGRLGRLLRSRRSPARRRERLRPSRTRNRDQPVRSPRLHRSPNAQPRRLCQIHRRRFLEWFQNRSKHRRPSRSPPHGSRKRWNIRGSS